MGRWSFLIFGGDIKEPFLRRMVFRVGLASLVAGFVYGVFDVGVTPVAGGPAYALAAMTFFYAAFIGYEFFRYYRCADEMVRETLIASLAVAGLVMLVCSGVYGLMDLLFALPQIKMIYVFLFATLVSSIAWFIAAWKNS
jgi:hypothetical protein